MCRAKAQTSQVRLQQIGLILELFELLKSTIGIFFESEAEKNASMYVDLERDI